MPLCAIKAKRGTRLTSDHTGRSASAAEIQKLKACESTALFEIFTAVVQLQAHKRAARLPHCWVQEVIADNASWWAIGMRDLLALEIYAACASDRYALMLLLTKSMPLAGCQEGSCLHIVWYNTIRAVAS